MKYLSIIVLLLLFSNIQAQEEKELKSFTEKYTYASGRTNYTTLDFYDPSFEETGNCTIVFNYNNTSDILLIDEDLTVLLTNYSVELNEAKDVWKGVAYSEGNQVYIMFTPTFSSFVLYTNEMWLFYSR